MTAKTLTLPRKTVYRPSPVGDSRGVEQAIERQTVHAPQFGQRFRRTSTRQGVDH